MAHLCACCALCVGAAGLLADSAMAQSASDAVYGLPPVVQGVTLGKPHPPTTRVSASEAGSLPFTGLAVGVLGGAGLLLVGLGLTARRMSNQRS